MRFLRHIGLILVASSPILDAGCLDNGDSSAPAATAQASLTTAAETLPPGGKPAPPLGMPEPPPQPQTYREQDLDNLPPDTLVYLASVARQKSNLPAMLQFEYWAVKNGGGSQYNLACAYGLNKQVDASLYWLERAGMESGVDAAHAQDDSDLKSVRADPRWPQMSRYLRQCNAYWSRSDIHEEILVLPVGHIRQRTIPILIGLHGKGSSATEFNSPSYQGFADSLNAALLLVSGTIPTGQSSFAWSDDQTENAKRIDRALIAVNDRLEVVQAPKMLWGFSQGGTVAIEVAARQPSRFVGAIALSPGRLDSPQATFPARSEGSPQQFVLVCGADEHRVTLITTRTYATIMRDRGDSVVQHEYPGVRQHSFPKDFEERFPEWTTSILAVREK